VVTPRVPRDQDVTVNQLHQHRLAVLSGLGSGHFGGRPVLPGYYVRHRGFPNSFGLVVSYVHTFGHPTQVMVLWSKSPTPENEDFSHIQQLLATAVGIPPAFLGFEP
jgi:hypothetical protein